MIKLKRLGETCKRYRRDQGVNQSFVAEETGYSLENVSAFECGRNDNCKIFLWYLLNGLTIDDIIRGEDNDDA